MDERAQITRVGFLVNPIAGMGGRVGLKGTDGLAGRAAALGAHRVAPLRAADALAALRGLLGADPGAAIHWLTCAGPMGADCLGDAGFTDLEIVHAARGHSTAADTKQAAAAFRAGGAALILFCGGDGTARDLCEVVDETVPILGIPAGVKMYSGVFGTSPARTAEIARRFLAGEIATARAEVLDLDEEKYRRGEWAVRLYYGARTPFEPSHTQLAKQLISEADDDAVKTEIAQYLVAEMKAQPETLYLLGPGSSVQAIGILLEIPKSLLGIDAVARGLVVGRDLDERGILDLLERYEDCKLILSPLGAQGFVLGRGNLQLSPDVIRRIGAANLVVIATPAKLEVTPALRFDTGDPALDRALAGLGYLPVVVGHGRRRLVKTAI